MFETLDQLLALGPEFALKFLVAVLCGGAIGMERETTGKPAGLRTSIVVCIGSMLFTQMSMTIGQMSGGDGGRIAAQIVSGIGFLGAGVILHERRGGVRGVTTAAMIWLIAAIGMMIGGGYMLSATAVSAATVFMVLSLRRVEVRLRRRRARTYHFIIRDDRASRQYVAAIVESYDTEVENFSIKAAEEGHVRVSFRFIGANSERRELLRGLYRLPGLRMAEGKKKKEEEV